jgi:Cys-tRNA(Pro)/Cys-tRNA(Cys) deacylase
MAKTNAIRILETEKIAFTIHEYDPSDGKIDGISVAGKIGIEAERVFKTLVTVGKTTGKMFSLFLLNMNLTLKKPLQRRATKILR